MPYNGERVVGNPEIRQWLGQPINRQFTFTEEEMARATSLQLVHSSFSDPGDDWNRVDLEDDRGIFASCTRPGY